MAKLDKIRFAKVVAYIGGAIARSNFDSTDVDVLDDMINIPDPEPQVISGKADAAGIDRLLELMAGGQRKIEAIKEYRILTGQGLKEAKDAVERYWVSKPIIEKNEGATLGDILGHINKK